MSGAKRHVLIASAFNASEVAQDVFQMRVHDALRLACFTAAAVDRYVRLSNAHWACAAGVLNVQRISVSQAILHGTYM